MRRRKPIAPQKILDGDIRSAARLMRLVDDQMPDALDILATLFPHTGHAHIVGVTGNPGSGKSTLVNKLIGGYRSQGKSVGCIAVDPTSPFSGGAILGDRVRMQEHALDDGVFIRSVATRGNLGGVSRSTPAMVQIMDAMHFDVIIIETVGVGQDEIDIVQMADTSVVVNVPGLGDDIQASKAGVLEIADVLVINKADRDGARRLRRELRTMLDLDMNHTAESWRPPIAETIAIDGQGVDKLIDAIAEHRQWLVDKGQDIHLARRRMKHYIELIATGHFERAMRQKLTEPAWDATLDKVVGREVDPYIAAKSLIEDMFA